MKFKVVIDTANKKIEHPRNVARALERLAHQLDVRFSWNYEEKEKSHGVIKTIDGCIVGTWEMESE